MISSEAVALVAQSANHARQMLVLADGLETAGIRPVLVAHDQMRRQRDRPAPVFDEAGRPWSPFPVPAWSPGDLLPWRRRFRSVPTVATVARWLGHLQVGAVVLGNDARPASRSIVRGARQAGVATVLVQDGIRTTTQGALSRRERLRPYLPTLRAGRYGLGGCDRVLVMSDRFAAELVSRGVDPASIVRTGFPLWDRLVTEDVPRPVAPSGPYLLYAATMAAVPDGVLVEHWARLADAARPLGRVLVVKLHPRDGRAEQLGAALAVRAPDAVVVDHGPILPLLAHADALATPYSTVALEALLLDVPVVLTRDVDFGHEIDLEDAAVIVDDPHDVGRAVAEAVELGPGRNRLVAAGRAFAERETHTADGRATERVVAVLAALVGSPAAATREAGP